MSSTKITDLPELLNIDLTGDDFIFVVDDSETVGSKDHKLKIGQLDERYVKNALEFNSLFDTAFDNKSTTDLSEGTKLFYTQTRFDTAFGNKSTTELSEGDKLFFTAQRVTEHTAVAANTGKRHDILTLTGTTGLSLNDQELTQAKATAAANGYLDKVDFAIFAAKLKKSSNDIDETSFTLAQGQGTSQNITGFTFDNTTTRAFEAMVSVEIDATSGLTEFIKLYGIQKNGSWTMVRDPLDGANLGDDTDVNFSITTIGTVGYVKYTSGTYTGFVSGKITFRALTTTI